MMLFDEDENDDDDVLPTNVLCVPARAISDEDLLLREAMHRHASGSIPVIFSDDADDGSEVLANPGAFTVLAAELGRAPTLPEAVRWIAAERARIDAEYAPRFAAMRAGAGRTNS